MALPDVPKDMTILYDHPYTSFADVDFTPRRKQTYPSLTGFVWASHWFQLAVEEPLELPAGSTERLEGVKVVTERFQRKLSSGKPPDAFPTELPLAPCISPGLVSAHVRAAAIIDNLNMMHDVLADVLMHPKVGDVRAAIDEVIVQFTDPRVSHRGGGRLDHDGAPSQHLRAGRPRARDDDGQRAEQLRALPALPRREGDAAARDAVGSATAHGATTPLNSMRI